jgi:SAM-dependent methyltransferase
MPPQEMNDRSTSAPDVGSVAARWDQTYRQGWAPWDIGRPQPAFVRLADAGEIAGPALDCGCGTGENTLMLAARGIEVVGIDIAPAAIEAARRKAGERGLSVDFEVANALKLGGLGRKFATVIDSGVFHTFDDPDRARYVMSLAGVVRPRGVVHLLCFSELTPGEEGPRRVTQAELRAAFAPGWEVEDITADRFEVLEDFPTRPHAWLAKIVRVV